MAWPLWGTLSTKAYNILRFISWLVNSFGGLFCACPWPPPSTCCSSFIIEEVPGGHMASWFSVMLFAHMFSWRKWWAQSLSVFFLFLCFSFSFIFLFFAWERWSCRVQKNAAEKVCRSGPAICILSQSLHSVAVKAAKALFPGLTLNSCSLHPSLMPSSDFHILLIPYCWFRLLSYILALHLHCFQM